MKHKPFLPHAVLRIMAVIVSLSITLWTTSLVRAGLITPEIWSAIGEAGASSGLAEQIALGDFNGDTYPDIAASDLNHDGGQGNGAGAVFVWYGRDTGFGASGTPANADWVVQGEVPGVYDNLGAQLAVADFNGDGYDDLAVGCVFCTESVDYEGAAYVYFGSDTGLKTNPTKANADWTATTAQDNAMMGSGYMIAGDVNNDTYPDLIVSTLNYDNGHTNEGAIFVWEGSATGLGVAGTPANADWRAESNQYLGALGVSLAVGDVNGDGYTDLAASRTQTSASYGHVVIWYGNASGLGSNGTLSNADWEAVCDKENAWFAAGKGTLVMADFDGDGYDEMVVGAANYDGDTALEESLGAVFVWAGSATGLGVHGTPANAAWMAAGENGYDYLGRMVTAGNLNGDSYADLSIIMEGRSPHVVIWYGSDLGLGVAGTPTNADNTLSTVGSWITLGDVGSAAVDDLLLGDALYDNPDTGKLYVYMTDAPPLNPTIVTETGGALDGIWQPGVSDPAFTWSGASDDSEVDGYYIYFGDDPGGTGSAYVSGEDYDPPAVSSGTYYLRISTRDDGGNQAPWETLFTFRYDGTAPTNPTAVVETGGTPDDTWQSDTHDPAFTWSGASDAHSGVAGYQIYFGTNANGTSSNFTANAAHDPPEVPDSGAYYLRVSTRDNAGNEAAWETWFTFRYDGTAPTNPTAVVETGGTPDDTWQSDTHDPAFTWSGASDAHSGVAGYRVYFGANPSGTSSNFTASAAYDPPAVAGRGTYYLRVRTRDNVDNEAAWETIFIFRYENPDELAIQPDIIAPPSGSCYATKPTLQISGGGVVSGDAVMAGYETETWQNGHRVDTLFLTPEEAAEWQPDLPGAGEYSLQIRSDAVLESGTHLYSEWVVIEYCYAPIWTLWLPLVFRTEIRTILAEIEPNNLFSEANPVTGLLPIVIHGTHDGEANTGDVFILDDDLVTAGEVVEVVVDTDNPVGLQLVAYTPEGEEIIRDHDQDHAISFIAPTSGSYYLYVFTDPGVNNTAAYRLTITVSP